MTALIIIGAILLVIALILFLPVHVTAVIRDDAAVFLRILFIKIKLFPMKEKPEKKEKKKKQKGAEKKKSEKKEEKKEKEKRNIPELVHSVADVLSVFLRQFSKHVKIRVLRYKIIIGTGDAAKTALLYGATEQATAYLFTALGKNINFAFSKKNSLVWVDFTSEKTVADVKIDVSINVFGALAMILPTFMAFVRNFGMPKSKNEDKTPSEKAPGKE